MVDEDETVGEAHQGTYDTWIKARSADKNGPGQDLPKGQVPERSVVVVKARKFKLSQCCLVLNA